MEELEEMIKWIDKYQMENLIFPHPNLIKMRMKLKVEDIKAKNNEVLDLVIPRFSISLVYQNAVNNMLRVLITDANNEQEAMGIALEHFEDEAKGYSLILKTVIKLNEV